MNTEPNKPRPADGNKSFLISFIGLLGAFAPAVIALACLKTNRPQPVLLPVLGMCDVFFSFASAAVLLRNVLIHSPMKPVLIIFLGGFFFVTNIVITLFIGCSGMGRIAP